jgi:hypothetical protein
MTLEEKIITRLDRHERLIKSIKAEIKKETWVKVSVVQMVTGWDNRFLEKARKNGLIQQRKTAENGIEYLLESINPIFIKINQLP